MKIDIQRWEQGRRDCILEWFKGEILNVNSMKDVRSYETGQIRMIKSDKDSKYYIEDKTREGQQRWVGHVQTPT